MINPKRIPKGISDGVPGANSGEIRAPKIVTVTFGDMIFQSPG